jgi:hypothetical protein
VNTLAVAITSGLLVAAIGAGCDRDDSIRVYQAPRDPPPAANVGAQPHSAPASQPVQQSAGAPWDIPPGWQQQPDKPMRVATFEAGGAEVIITRFGSESFSSLLANINRWRAQVGLEPLDDANAVKSQEVAVGRHKAKMFDMIGPEKAGSAHRLRVAVLVNGPEVWYFKMQGPSGAVEQQASAFDQFLQSVRLVDSSEQ